MKKTPITCSEAECVAATPGIGRHAAFVAAQRKHFLAVKVSRLHSAGRFSQQSGLGVGAAVNVRAVNPVGQSVDLRTIQTNSLSMELDNASPL